MSVLRNLENRIAGLVEGTFGRVFRSEVRPVEIARKLAKEMDENRTVSVSRVYVPNEYVVWLGPEDRTRFDGVERDVVDELAAYLLEHARRERLALVSTPKITFETDDALSLGEFGIQARLVRAAEGAVVEQAAHGHTAVYSAAARQPEELSQARADKDFALRSPHKAIVVVGDRRMLVGAGGSVLGRSRECDIVVDDANVSRRHAEVRPAHEGWTIADLGSTNGVRVNGRDIGHGVQALRDGDRVELGTALVTFQIQ